MSDGLSIGTLSTGNGATRLVGSSSKLDTEAIIQASYEAKRLPAVRLENKITENEAKAAAFGELRTLVGGLKDALDGLRSPPGYFGARDNIFESKQAFFASDTVIEPGELLGVSVDNLAQTGKFDVVVDQIAQAHKTRAAAAASTATSLKDAWNGGADFASTVSIGLDGGSAAEIQMDGDMTLADLRAAINGVSTQTGLTANIVTVSDSEARLVLTAQETGQQMQVTNVTGDGATLMGLTDIQSAQPARLEVDGLTIERDSNEISDIIEGVSLSLYKADVGTTVTVSIEPAMADAKAQIESFVEAYNAIADFSDTHSSVSETGEVGEDAVLYGSSTLRSIDQSLSSFVSAAASGLPADSLDTLRSVGITLDERNRLTVDDAVLDTSLLENLQEVRNVFEFNFVSSSTDLTITQRSNALADFDFSVEVTDADADGVPESVTIDGVAAELDGNVIKGAAGTDHDGLSMVWAGVGSNTIDVQVSQGIADKMYNYAEGVASEVDGVIESEIGSLSESNTRYADQISRITERADLERERLIERFTAMEAALSLSNMMLEQIRAQTDAWSGKS